MCTVKQAARRLGWAGAIAAAAVPAAAQVSNTEWPDAPLPSAPEVLRQVRATFPAVPWRIAAELICRDGSDEIRRTYGVDMRLDMRAAPPRATITLRDAFGAEIATARVRRPAEAPAAMELSAPGAPPRPIEPDEPAAETGVAWGDLALDFLWWPGGRVAGLEMKKSRECVVVDLPGPAGARYAAVRAWIDAREHILLQADAFDAARRLVRRLAVKSLKKMDGHWTIEDFDIESPTAGERVTLRVRESRADESVGADRDGAA